MGHPLSYRLSRQAIDLPDPPVTIHLWFPEYVESRQPPILSSITGSFLFHSTWTRKTAHLQCGLGQRPSLSGWFLLSFVGIPCGDHSHYNVCATSCPATCSNALAPWNCTKPCVEGCECDKGFVLSGAQCVPQEDCGCVDGDQYYEVCSPAMSSAAPTEPAATFATGQGPHLFLGLFSNRKERASGSRVASADVAVKNTAPCPASQTVAKKTKSAKYRTASWDATFQTPPVTSTETLTMSPSTGDSIISRVGAITPQCKSAATPPSASPSPLATNIAPARTGRLSTQWPSR